MSGGLAFVERQRRGLHVMLDAAAAGAYAALQHDVAHRFLALAAARSNTEFKLKFVERVDAFRDRGTDRSVGN
ncbi:conserved hypothetical protein [Paraburkholderia ribeironis]|uniref:Uncharacterized protein n=1 Tax=Paraburkholderia ribeironis TaxID=1247936 RepID=A0A1N7SID1_9BURK|nr:conserved hypothetical protein [Paraburkholderia ribeironis]